MNIKPNTAEEKDFDLEQTDVLIVPSELIPTQLLSQMFNISSRKWCFIQLLLLFISNYTFIYVY